MSSLSTQWRLQKVTESALIPKQPLSVDYTRTLDSQTGCLNYYQEKQ